MTNYARLREWARQVRWPQRKTAWIWNEPHTQAIKDLLTAVRVAAAADSHIRIREGYGGKGDLYVDVVRNTPDIPDGIRL